MSKKKVKRVSSDGRTFILCTFSMRFGPIVLEESDNIAAVFKAVPEHLADVDSDGDRLSVCRVGYWTVDVGGDESDATPRELVTIAEIQPYAVDAVEDAEETGEASVGGTS